VKGVWPVDRGAKDSDVAPVDGCSHHASRKDSSSRPKNNSHRMNGKVYSSSIIPPRLKNNSHRMNEKVYSSSMDYKQCLVAAFID
jgi:hypothetical protein